MKKSQISLFVFTGIILIIFIVFFIYAFSKGNNSFYLGENKRVVTLSDVKIDISSYIHSCIKDAASEALQDTGIREETVNEYKRLVTSKIKACSDAFFAHLQEQQNYEITKGDINVNVELNDDSIKVDIDYPITVEHEGDKIDFREFHYVFDRSVSVKIPGGVTNKEMRFTASNGKAQIVLPKGVKITDINGKPVENIGLKIEDVHFDGLENRYALGQLVYEGFPDKIFFSKPVELSIDFREEDIPEGYTTNNLMIAYWDNESEIWFALPTEIREKRAIANITHFTFLGIFFVRLYLFNNKLFEQRYTPSRAGTERNLQAWWIQEDTSDITAGTASLQPGDHPDYVNGIQPEEFVKWNYYPTDQEMLVESAPIDFKLTYQGKSNEFLSYPKIQYGYFKNPENPSDADFVDCEPEEITTSASYHITYQSVDDKPYFYLFDPKCRVGITCSECQKSGQNGDECVNKNNCMAFGEQICVPYEEDDTNTEDTIVPCCLENPPAIKESSPKVFGWHNYQCVGGMVRPADDQEASDFIVFEPNGNAVLGLINVLPKPQRYSSYFGQAETLTPKLQHLSEFYRSLLFGLFIEQQDLSPNTQQGEGYPFYCNIKPFPETGNPFQEIEVSSSIKERLGFSSRDNMVAYGVYGLDIIKMTNHPETKSELHTQCWLYWSLIGNGFYKNTPDTFSFNEIEQGCDLLPSPQNLPDWIPDWPLSTIRTLCDEHQRG